MAQQRVAEGKARIARQEALIMEMEPDRRDHMLSQANAFFLELPRFQVITEEYLTRELAGAGG